MYKPQCYFKPENRTDIRDFTKFGMKISPVQDLQELPNACVQCTINCEMNYT